MRRLISMLAAGLLAAGTLFATAGAASAGTAAVHHRSDCTIVGSAYVQFQSASGVNYYVGTPNTTSSGATVRLKPKKNLTTLWAFCETASGEFVILNRNLAMTSRDFSPGGTVTVTTPGGPDGFASQRWFPADSTTFQNEKTGLFLRIRNSGPSFGQTVTTGFTATAWQLA
jgi:hypothetical protein